MMRALDVSTSALIAQRTRLNAVSGNIANMSSLTDETGAANPYQARQVVFQTDDSISINGASGVKRATPCSPSCIAAKRSQVTQPRELPAS